MSVVKPKINVVRLAPRRAPSTAAAPAPHKDTRELLAARCKDMIKETTPEQVQTPPLNPAPPSAPRTSAPPKRNVNAANKVKVMEYINNRAYHTMLEQKMNLETSHMVVLAKPAKGKDGTPHIEDIVILDDKDMAELAAWLQQKKGTAPSVAPLWEEVNDEGDDHW